MEKEQLKADLMARFMASATDEFTVQQLVDELQMTKAGQFKFVVKALADLEHEHKITLNQNGAFWLKTRLNLSLKGFFTRMTGVLVLSLLIRKNRISLSTRHKPSQPSMEILLKLR